MLSYTEENYLKAIFKLAESGGTAVNTNAIAAAMNTTAASATDMVKRLAEKQLLKYEKYKGVLLTRESSERATLLIRRHRLWEVFLTEKLGYSWCEVHDIAEELEHIGGTELSNRLDTYLGHPRFDPHGDPIPDAEGNWTHRKQVLLATLQPGQSGVVTGVNDHTPVFLQYLEQIDLRLGTQLTLGQRNEYDQTLLVELKDKSIYLSHKVAQNLFVELPIN